MDRRRKGKAQSSIEYFIIAMMVMMFMVPIWVYIVTTQHQATDQLGLSYTQNAAKSIADAASLVHSQGSPAKIRVKVYVPFGITNISSQDKTIIFLVGEPPDDTEIWYSSSATLTGAENIPTNEGNYYLDIISHDTYVEINRTW